MDQEHISMQMAPFMKESGTKTINMEQEKKLGPTATATKERTCKAKRKDKVS